MINLSGLNKNERYIVSFITPPNSRQQTDIQKIQASLNPDSPVQAYHTGIASWDNNQWQILNTALPSEDLLTGNIPDAKLENLEQVLKKNAQISQSIVAQKTEASPSGMQANIGTPYGVPGLFRLGLKYRDQLPIQLMGEMVLKGVQQISGAQGSRAEKIGLAFINSQLRRLPENLTYGQLKESGQYARVIGFIEGMSEKILNSLENSELPGKFCSQISIESTDANSKIRQVLHESPADTTPTALLEASTKIAGKEYDFVTLSGNNQIAQQLSQITA
jgi:hypothetical protein